MPTSTMSAKATKTNAWPESQRMRVSSDAHSRRSVALAVRSPEALKSGRPMLYGYLTVTVTGSPVFTPAVQVIRLEIVDHCVAETVFWIAVRRGGAGACGPIDRRCPRADARRVGDREVVVEREAELADAQHEHHEDRQDDRELDERLPVIALQLRPNVVCACLMSGEECGQSLRRRGGPDP